MTEPLDLDAVQRRYDLANDQPLGETGETMQEWRDRVDLELAGRAFESSDDVPALIAEIRRLQQLLHPVNDATANLLHAGWLAAEEALRDEAEDWARVGQYDRSSALRTAVGTLARLDDRPKSTPGQRIPVWLKVGHGHRQQCEAWYDPTRGGWVLDDHPLVPEIERLEGPADGQGPNRDPDWYLAQQAADLMFHRMGEEP
jgi:hypothetical protein